MWSLLQNYFTALQFQVSRWVSAVSERHVVGVDERTRMCRDAQRETTPRCAAAVGHLVWEQSHVWDVVDLPQLVVWCRAAEQTVRRQIEREDRRDSTSRREAGNAKITTPGERPRVGQVTVLQCEELLVHEFDGRCFTTSRTCRSLLSVRTRLHTYVQPGAHTL